MNHDHVREQIKVLVAKARTTPPWEMEPYYCAWVEMLTHCNLHEKSDIAAVLAYLTKEKTDVQL